MTIQPTPVHDLNDLTAHQALQQIVLVFMLCAAAAAARTRGMR